METKMNQLEQQLREHEEKLKVRCSSSLLLCIKRRFWLFEKSQIKIAVLIHANNLRLTCVCGVSFTQLCFKQHPHKTFFRLQVSICSRLNPYSRFFSYWKFDQNQIRLYRCLWEKERERGESRSCKLFARVSSIVS